MAAAPADPGPPVGRGRRRALVLGVLALLCAALSAGAAAHSGAGADAGLGPLRTVVVAERPLERGSRLGAPAVAKHLVSREIPALFAPPDALADPAAAAGSRTAVRVPAGSYLTAAILARRPPHGEHGPSSLPAGLRPVEVEVSGGPAGSSSGLPRPGSRVDVLAADEPGSTTDPRVHVLARDVRLLSLTPVPADESGGDPTAGGWLATLALDRPRALAVIEADNYAREVRLLAR